MKKVSLGFIIVFLLCTVFISGVFAQSTKGGGRRPIPVPEPVSILLFLASGGTYAGIRYLRARKNSKKLSKHFHETDEIM